MLDVAARLHSKDEKHVLKLIKTHEQHGGETRRWPSAIWRLRSCVLFACMGPAKPCMHLFYILMHTCAGYPLHYRYTQGCVVCVGVNGSMDTKCVCVCVCVCVLHKYMPTHTWTHMDTHTHTSSMGTHTCTHKFTIMGHLREKWGKWAKGMW